MRPPVLKDHILLAEGTIFPCFNVTEPATIDHLSWDHVCMANGVVFQDRFYCIYRHQTQILTRVTGVVFQGRFYCIYWYQTQILTRVTQRQATILVAKGDLPDLSLVPSELANVRQEVLRLFVHRQPSGWVDIPDIQRSSSRHQSQTILLMQTPPKGRRDGWNITRLGDDLLFSHMPHDDQIVGWCAGKQVRVLWVPGYGSDCLFMLWHDAKEPKFMVPEVKLKKKKFSKTNTSGSKNLNQDNLKLVWQKRANIRKAIMLQLNHSFSLVTM